MAGEIYKPVHSVPVTGHSHEHIQGVSVNLQSSPFTPDKYEPLSVIGMEEFFTGETSLRKISPLHGRSFEFGGGQKVVWSDEFGNVFTSLNTKGNNLTHPEVMQSGGAFEAFGMQSSIYMRRVLQASEIMRKAKIETEVVTHVIEPLVIPFKGQEINIQELKAALIDQLGTNAQVSPEQRVILGRYFADMTFFISTRAMQVNERVEDLRYLDDEGLKTAISNAFYYTNLVERINAKKENRNNPLQFSTDKPEDVSKYFSDYLPKKIGKNYARLHALGLVHKYPTMGNVNLIGGIVDLDSVTGEVLGDSYEDVRQINDLEFLLHYFQDVGELIKKLTPNYDKFLFNIAQSYLDESIKLKSSNLTSVVNSVCAIPQMMDEDATEEQENKAVEDYLEFAFQNLPIRELPIEEIIDHLAGGEWNIRNYELTVAEKVSILSRTLQSLMYGQIDGQFIASKFLVDVFIAFVKVFPNEGTEEYAPIQNAPEVIVSNYISTQIKSKADRIIGSLHERIMNEFGDDGSSDVGREERGFIHFFSSLARSFGWEADIAKYAAHIEDTLNLWQNAEFKDDPIQRELKERYLHLFTQQTGIDLPSMHDFDSVYEEFQRIEREKAQEYERMLRDQKRYNEMLSSNTISQNDMEEFGQIIKRRNTDRNNWADLSEYFSERFSRDRYINFVTSKEKEVDQFFDLKNRIADASENPFATFTILHWFFDRFRRPLSGDEADEKLEIAEREAEQWFKEEAPLLYKKLLFHDAEEEKTN